MEDKRKRNTKQKKIVYDAVMSRCDHPSADEIFLQLQDGSEAISRATVYRNLGLLADDGSVTRVMVPGADRFDSKLDKHYHIICTSCGAVVDAPFDYNPDEDKQAEEASGYLIERHRTVFLGLCPECRKKQGK